MGLDEIRRITDAATPGPWTIQGAELLTDSEGVILLSGDYGGCGYFLNDQDAQFVMNARTWVPELLERIDQLGSVIDELVDTLMGVRDE